MQLKDPSTIFPGRPASSDPLPANQDLSIAPCQKRIRSTVYNQYVRESTMLTRRNFLHTSGAALATRLFAAPADAKKPNPELETLGAVALREARKLKASY